MFFTQFNHEFQRIILSAFYHGSEMHLVYNMGSLLWKGRQLELHMGSGHFGVLVSLMTGQFHGCVFPLW